MEKLHPEFYKTFDQETLDLIIEAVKKASDTASELYDEDRGSNNKVFGFGHHEYLKFQFVELSQKYPHKFQIIRKGNWVGLRVGIFDFGFYKVGYSEKTDIKKSFPQNTCGAVRMVQLALFEDSVLDEDLKDVTRFILAYQTNPVDGVCSINFGIPLKSSGSKKIDEWAYIHPIYEIDREVSTFEAKASVVEVSPEIVQDYELRKRTKNSDNVTNG